MKQEPLRIGIACFPTFGGSGIIATEIAIAMAQRGHEMHVVAYDLPQRFDRFQDNLFYHEVESGHYPLFTQPYYPLTLASKLVEIAESESLDLFHVHYAIPHATSAYLAREILGARSPKIVTTLHGTDITLVGHERSYLPIVRFSIMESDHVTVPSNFLREATYTLLNVSRDTGIEVIPNFVNTDRFAPSTENMPHSSVRSASFRRGEEKLITHVSNFRPVKRVSDVIEVFAQVVPRIAAHLVLIGDGPERSKVERLVRRLGLSDRVFFLGRQHCFVEILRESDLFLLPSETESFGLAALEAMSCGVPVIASRVGGLPELILDGETGYLCDVGDTNGMARHALAILENPELSTRFRRAARGRAVLHFNREGAISRYETTYYRVLERT